MDDVTECASFFALKAWAVSRSAVRFRRQYADIACTIGLYFLRSKQKISACRLWMHIRSLWMAVCSLWMAVQSLQTEISARCVGHFSTLPSSVQHAANATAACRRETGISKEALPNHADGRAQCTASLCDAGCGAALMMRQKKDRSVTERFVAACLWAAQPDEASPVTERLLM